MGHLNNGQNNIFHPLSMTLVCVHGA